MQGLKNTQITLEAGVETEILAPDSGVDEVYIQVDSGTDKVYIKNVTLEAGSETGVGVFIKGVGSDYLEDIKERVNLGYTLKSTTSCVLNVIFYK